MLKGKALQWQKQLDYDSSPNICWTILYTFLSFSFFFFWNESLRSCGITSLQGPLWLITSAKKGYWRKGIFSGGPFYTAVGNGYCVEGHFNFRYVNGNQLWAAVRKKCLTLGTSFLLLCGRKALQNQLTLDSGKKRTGFQNPQTIL